MLKYYLVLKPGRISKKMKLNLVESIIELIAIVMRARSVKKSLYYFVIKIANFSNRYIKYIFLYTNVFLYKNCIFLPSLAKF